MKSRRYAQSQNKDVFQLDMRRKMYQIRSSASSTLSSNFDVAKDLQSANGLVHWKKIIEEMEWENFWNRGFDIICWPAKGIGKCLDIDLGVPMRRKSLFQLL